MALCQLFRYQNGNKNGAALSRSILRYMTEPVQDAAEEVPRPGGVCVVHTGTISYAEGSDPFPVVEAMVSGMNRISERHGAKLYLCAEQGNTRLFD